MTFITSRRPGFTLLELLVVISIIGILMTLGVAAFSTAQKKGRDAKRQGDIKSIQNAFEQYYADNSGYGTCDAMTTADYFSSGTRPVDPKTGVNYTCTSTGTTYCVCATLDDTTGGNATDASCTFGAGAGYFCLKNLQ